MSLASFRRGCQRLVLVATLVAGASCALAQSSGQSGTVPEPLPADSRPKDVLTRAKAHTELGALYFQDGNLIVALEELSLAIAIHPEYAPAYSAWNVSPRPCSEDSESIRLEHSARTSRSVASVRSR